MEGYLLAIFLILVYLISIKKLIRSKYLSLAMVFLFISPWFVQLLVSGYQLWWARPLITSFDGWINNLSINSSFDFLFFKGDPNVKYGNQETGPFYIFQIPLIALGIYSIFLEASNYKKILVYLSILAILISSVFKYAADFSSSLILFLPLQIISFLGVEFMINRWRKEGILVKSLFIIFFLLCLYEITFFSHIMIIHYPKRL